MKFHTGDVSPPRSAKCFLVVEANSLARRPVRSTTEIWVVTRHQYGISALVPQTSFRGETSGGVVKSVLFIVKIIMTTIIIIIIIIVIIIKIKISNGNRTEWSPIRSVIIRVINKIGRPRSGKMTI